MATLSVQAPVTVSLFYTREITPSSKEKPEETSIIQRGRQLKLNADNKVNTNDFASISFQENGKVFPKVEKTGGRLRNFEHEWQKITNDSEILTYVRGCPIDFDSEPLSYQEPTNHMAFSSQECEIINNEIEGLLVKGAIQVSEHENGEVISRIFLRYKKDGSPRPIINLKNLNSHIVYSHFKMETLKHALDLISEGCWLASLEIKIDKNF